MQATGSRTSLYPPPPQTYVRMYIQLKIHCYTCTYLRKYFLHTCLATFSAAYLLVFFLSQGPDVDQPYVSLLAADLLRREHWGLPQPLQNQYVQEGLLAAGCLALQLL